MTEVRDRQREHVTGAGEHLKKEDYLSPTKSPTFKKGRMKEGKELEASVSETVTHLQNNVYAQEQETVFTANSDFLPTYPSTEETEDTN